MMRTIKGLTPYGPWAIVTGASDGIGEAFARQIAASGINLVLIARRQDKLERLKTELENTHSIQAIYFAHDLSNIGERQEIYEKTSHLQIGLAVLAAGFGTSGSFLDNAIAHELNMIEVNCAAVAEMAHHYGRTFRRQGKGGLVLFSSIVGFQGAPNAANYAATKAYIQSLAEGLYHELKPEGIDVVVVAPGPVKSGFAARANMTMRATDSPDTVARAGLHSLGKRNLVRPGFVGKFLSFSLSTAPRKLRVRIMEKVMQGMANETKGITP